MSSGKQSSMMSKMYETATDILRKVDIYGAPIKMNFDGKQSKIKTSFGGFLTLLLALWTALYSGNYLHHIIKRSNMFFIFSTYIAHGDLNSMKSLAEFDDTFNMFIDIRKKDFNWFDNPYIRPNIYEINENLQSTLSKNIKFQICKKH